MSVQTDDITPTDASRVDDLSVLLEMRREKNVHLHSETITR